MLILAFSGVVLKLEMLVCSVEVMPVEVLVYPAARVLIAKLVFCLVVL